MFRRHASYLIALLFLAQSLCASAAPLLWLEAERFADPGGWTNDSQFIDQMGSPYLLAAGLGQPVADAVTTIKPPAPGRYRLWLRTRDWSPQQHPGTFKVLIDGKAAGPVFGASGKKGWLWEDGGEVTLNATSELRLHDLTGYYGRCDALALSPDLQWTPPAEIEAVAKLREVYGGVSPDVKEMGAWDVVVAGGGLAGCLAAVSAARLGARVVLIQDRPVLGGNGSTEVLVPPVGITNPGSNRSALDPHETGLLEEIRTAGRQKTSEAKVYSSRLLRLVAQEPNLALFLNTHATGVVMKDKETIAAVEAVDTLSGQRTRYHGRIFIDCTGDSTVGVAAGAEWRQGREGRAEFGESMAPEKADKTTMGNSLKYVGKKADGPQSFTAPAWAMKFPDENFPKGRHPRHPDLEIEWQWMLELGGMGDTFREKEETRDELFKLIYGLWDHIKNVCPDYKDKLADYRLEWVQTVVGVRESRRLIGDYIFHQEDVVNQILHPDRIAYGSWGLDDHPSEGFFQLERNSNHKFGGILHSIPYRSLYSKNIGNLMMAGRNVSASHVGMGTTRVMLTCAIMGHAAGTAAGMAIEKRTSPRGIYQDHIGELQQQLLKDGAFMIDLPNRDPRDLARQAHVSASSEATTTTVIKGQAPQKEKLAAANVIDGFARVTKDGAHAWEADKKAAGPHWIELAWDKPQVMNMVHVSGFKKEIAARHFTVLAWRDGAWVTVGEVTNPAVMRRCLVPLGALGAAGVTTTKLRLVLDKPAGICEIRVYNEPERELEIARRAMANMLQPDTDAFYPWEKK